MIGFEIVSCEALGAALIWRLRGGAFATLSGVNIGTSATRIAAALLMALIFYVATRSYWGFGLAPCLFAGMSVAGWGPFQGMGLEQDPGYVPEKSWLRWLPEQLGLKPGTFFHDFVGMAEAGAVCVLPSALFVAWLNGWSLAAFLLVIFAGLGFSVAYTLAKLIPFPTIPRFAEGQAWGEVLAGALLGAALGFSLLHL
jgi:hypothetical protein